MVDTKLIFSKVFMCLIETAPPSIVDPFFEILLTVMCILFGIRMSNFKHNRID
jgi:hypothetical protein